jgi:hypothetical protein
MWKTTRPLNLGKSRCGPSATKIAYAKTLAWQHEGAYRLVIPLRQGEEPWNTLAYHPEEITGLYLGAALTDTDKQDIVAKAKALNPQSRFFRRSGTTKGGSVSTGYDAVYIRHSLRGPPSLSFWLRFLTALRRLRRSPP